MDQQLAGFLQQVLAGGTPPAMTQVTPQGPRFSPVSFPEGPAEGFGTLAGGLLDYIDAKGEGEEEYGTDTGTPLEWSPGVMPPPYDEEPYVEATPLPVGRPDHPMGPGINEVPTDQYGNPLPVPGSPGRFTTEPPAPWTPPSLDPGNPALYPNQEPPMDLAGLTDKQRAVIALMGLA